MLSKVTSLWTEENELPTVPAGPHWRYLLLIFLRVRSALLLVELDVLSHLLLTRPHYKILQSKWQETLRVELSSSPTDHTNGRSHSKYPLLLKPLPIKWQNQWAQHSQIQPIYSPQTGALLGRTSMAPHILKAEMYKTQNSPLENFIHLGA